MSKTFSERIEDLLLLDIGYKFCPPTDENIINVTQFINEKILNNPDQVEAELLLQECETKASVIAAEGAVRKIRANRKEAGRTAREACNNVLDLIAGFNLEMSLTTEQINNLKATFSDIKEYLKDAQPWAAKPLIEAIIPDDNPVTDEMKQSILDELAASGLSGL